MLAKIDLKRIFASANKRGFVGGSLYAETVFHSRVEWRDKYQSSRFDTSGGISLQFSSGKALLNIHTEQCDTEALLALIKGTGSPSRDWNEKTSPAAGNLTCPVSKDYIKKVSEQLWRLTRHYFGPNSRLRYPVLEYHDQTKLFEVAYPNEKTFSGREESASVRLGWILEHKKRFLRFQTEVHRNSIEDLLLELQREDLFERDIHQALRLINPWPAPKGEIPVLWSSRAISKLCHQFLRAFEADRVLSKLSFLNECDLPLDLPFSIVEKPNLSKLACDHEGSPRKNLLIFDEGKPKALACNLSTAEQLAVTSTGHCRRSSFKSHPTIGFWSPQVIGHQQSDNLLSQLEWGLSIRDIQLKHFEPSETTIHLQVTDASLVHQGKEGEPIESFDLHINLLELLKSLKLFSKETTTTGLVALKHQQELVTEITAPAAISPAIPIPGAVPLSHYW